MNIIEMALTVFIMLLLIIGILYLGIAIVELVCRVVGTAVMSFM